MADAEASTAMADEARPDEKTVQVLRDLANRLRIHAIRATCASSSGHPMSCSSAAEIMSVLFFHTMRYKQSDPENPDNDRFILSKRLSFVDVATGWLGQGLGAACGMAYTGKYFDKASYRVFCLMGDGESSEGSVWEALAFASYYGLDNLVAIFDVNRLGHSGTLPAEHCIDIYQKRCEAFGWNTYVVDGRDVEALCRVFWQATQVKSKPTAVVAKTFKGRGLPNVEDAENWYGKPMSKERADAIIKLIESQIQTNRNPVPKPPIEDSPQISIMDIEMTSLPAYKVGDKMATLKACGFALAKLGHANDRVIVLDGDTKNTTFSEIFKKEHPERFIECLIAEQNMGMCFIRTTRPETAVIYTPQETFEIGQAKVIRHSDSDKVTVIGAGVTLHEALAAADDLSKQDISIRVIDLFTIKPLDAATIISSAKATGGRVITVEDHYPEGGIGEAVCAAISMEPDILVHQLAVSGVPRNGKPDELLDMFGISARHIIAAVKCISVN
ncbi:transketolase-like protein 1 isoform X2 [Microcebus murinus]|uniref:transketolase-like protein 1 isoform X2 n=1 Tax=Microcebus murinus TaxID=30608 RepID=UPI003F6A6CBF